MTYEALSITDKKGTAVDVNAVMIFLDVVRETGKVNMFGAGPYIAKQFKVTDRDSRKLLAHWMDTFRDRNPRA